MRGRALLRGRLATREATDLFAPIGRLITSFPKIKLSKEPSVLDLEEIHATHHYQKSHKSESGNSAGHALLSPSGRAAGHWVRHSVIPHSQHQYYF